MKYSILLSMLLLFACGYNHSDVRTNLLNEQKTLKDSTFNITERIGSYLQKSAYASVEAENKQLETVYARLIAIQTSIDSLDKLK